jgi:putative PIN family toxin of toxin-antitoxin system
VVDTNVVVSSLFGGKPRQVLDLWRDRQIVLCLSDDIVAEYLEVFTRFGDVEAEIRDLVDMLTERDNVLFAHLEERIQHISDDPADDRFLECAVAAAAEAIVSGDRHLLNLREFRGIAILDPAAFLARWDRG